MKRINLFIKLAFILLPTSQAFAVTPLLPLAIGLGGGILVDRANPSTDVGEIDYAVAPITDTNASNQNKCTKVFPKYSQDIKNRPVKPNEIYEVILKHMKLGKDAKHLTGFTDSISGHIQIAVVAKGFEMSNSNGTSNGFDFSPTSADAGRVVYYSDDVKPEQNLNFGQITMFGPAKYGGNPIGVSLFVFKIANDTGGKMAPMLSSLAKMGATVANPDVLGVLDTLGTQLLQGQDENVFRYDTMLRNECDNNQQPCNQLPQDTANLVYGDYILIRQEDRTKPFDWTHKFYNYTNGKLYTDQTCSTEDSDDSYGVIQIASATQEAYMKYASYSELRNAISVAVSSSNPHAAAAALKTASNSYVQNLMMSQATTLIDTSASSTTRPSPTEQARLHTLLLHIKDSIDAIQAKGTLDLTKYFSEDAVRDLLFEISVDTNKTIYTETSFDPEAAFTDFSTTWPQQ